MNIDYLNEIVKIYDKLKDNKEMVDLVNDIKTIDNMVTNGVIDFYKINNIVNRYHNEINTLSNIDKEINSKNNINTNSSNIYDYPSSLINTLVRVGAIKLSKSKCKDIIESKLVGTNKTLFLLVSDIIDKKE